MIVYCCHIFCKVFILIENLYASPSFTSFFNPILTLEIFSRHCPTLPLYCIYCIPFRLDQSTVDNGGVRRGGFVAVVVFVSDK